MNEINDCCVGIILNICMVELVGNRSVIGQRWKIQGSRKKTNVNKTFLYMTEISFSVEKSVDIVRFHYEEF